MTSFSLAFLLRTTQASPMKIAEQARVAARPHRYARHLHVRELDLARLQLGASRTTVGWGGGEHQRCRKGLSPSPPGTVAPTAGGIVAPTAGGIVAPTAGWVVAPTAGGL
jgi:hypothetical protein